MIICYFSVIKTAKLHCQLTDQNRLSYGEHTGDAVFGSKIANTQQTATLGEGLGLFFTLSAILQSRGSRLNVSENFAGHSLGKMFPHTLRRDSDSIKQDLAH